jgi:hypothetical protein
MADLHPSELYETSEADGWIAVGVKTRPAPDKSGDLLISWHDGIHQREFPVAGGAAALKPDLLGERHFWSWNGTRHRIAPLSLERWNGHIRHLLLRKLPAFETRTELVAAVRALIDHG